MEITLNNAKEILNTQSTSITVDELLAIKNFTFELLIVRINNRLIKKESYSVDTIKEGDKVDVIHVFGGG